MASGLSRVPTHGTIFSRIKNLLRAGVIKDRDKPIWYDVMEAFPPKNQGTLPGVDHDGPYVRQILYPEDSIRAKFYKVYGQQQALNLQRQGSVSATPCAKFISKYQELEKTWDKSEDELFEATAKDLIKEGTALKKRGERRAPSTVQMEKNQQRENVIESLAALFEKSSSAIEKTSSNQSESDTSTKNEVQTGEPNIQPNTETGSGTEKNEKNLT